MLSSSERQVRSAGCMLKTVICKTDNWRGGSVELCSRAGVAASNKHSSESTAQRMPRNGNVCF